MRRADRYLNAVDSELLAYSLLAKIQRDTKNVQRAESVRKARITQGCEDRRDLVTVILSYEAADRTRAELERLGDTVDELYGRILYHSVLLELTIDYAYQWTIARGFGYKKQLATFILGQQELSAGRTSDNPANVWPHAWFEDSISQEDLETDLSYGMLFDTVRDYRGDEEHERRVEVWKHKNGL